MTNADHDRDDRQLRALASGAVRVHEQSVSEEQTQAALAAVREQTESRGPDSPVVPLREQRAADGGRPDRRRSLVIGSAAAVLVLVAGLVLVLRDRGDNSIVDNPVTSMTASVGTGVDPTPVPTSAAIDSTTLPPTILPTTTVAPSTSNPTTSSPAASSPATSVPQAPGAGLLAIPNHCTADPTFPTCTQLANTTDGRIVAYDPLDETLRTYDPTGQQQLTEVRLAEPLGAAVPAIETVGPDEVVYITRTTPGATDPLRDLLAIPLLGPNAGRSVMTWSRLDGSGDTDLVAARTGLAAVGCCGPFGPRPAPDAQIYGYVDRNGAPATTTAPTFRLDLGDAGNTLNRLDPDGTVASFPLPTVAEAPRGVPPVVATADGGALMSLYSQVYARQYLVHFQPDWPQHQVDNSDVVLVDDAELGGPIVLLEPTETVVVRSGDQLIRRTLDEVGTRGWPGTPTVVFDAGTTAAPGLNAYISANRPAWATDPVLFGLQIAQTLGPNESVQIEFDGPTGVLTITTSGLLDDSTAAVRTTIRTERGPDGLLRFLGGSYGQQCRPGRGHQDFSTELCI